MPAVIDDPSLLDRILRSFRIKGRIRPFDIQETAVPVFEIGNLAGLLPQVVTTTAGQQGVRVGQANNAYLATAPLAIVSGDVNSVKVVNPTAAQVILDTGQLGSGTHLMWVDASWSAAGALSVEVQWRNAADDGTLATWFLAPAGDGSSQVYLPFLSPFFVLNERIRMVTPAAGTGSVCANITIRAVTVSAAV